MPNSSLKFPLWVARAGLPPHRASAASLAIAESRSGGSISARRAPPIFPAFLFSLSMRLSDAWHLSRCLTGDPFVKHFLKMLSITQTEKRSAGLLAGGAFLRAEAWQSGLSHRAYPSADLWVSIPLAGSREFESHRFHHQISGAVAVGAETTPDHHPGDEPDATTVLSNIRLGGRTCQSRHSSTLQPKDELRERTFRRQANRSYCRPL